MGCCTGKCKFYSRRNSKAIATEPFILVTKPHPKRVEGFPLDSLSVDVESGKYYYDLDVKDVSTSVDDGVRAFFTEIFSVN